MDTNVAKETPCETSNVQLKMPKKYIHKRTKCMQCEKQFNKKETYQKHMETVHMVKVQIETSSNKEIPPKENMTLQKMLTRKAKAALGTITIEKES